MIFTFYVQVNVPRTIVVRVRFAPNRLARTKYYNNISRVLRESTRRNDFANAHE